MGVNERSLTVIDFVQLIIQLHVVKLVNLLNMLSDIFLHNFPRMWGLFVDLKSAFLGVPSLLTQKSGVMHEFLGDATDIDAGSSRSPRGSLWRRPDIVSQCDLSS